MIDVRHIIFQILPTPAYIRLSNEYHRFLNYSETIRSHENYDRNIEKMFFALVIGISLGLGLVTFLEFFPGEPFSMKLEKDLKKEVGKSSINTTKNEKHETENIPNKETEEIKTNANVKIVERTGQKLGLSEEEIEKFLQQTKQAHGGELFRDLEDDLDLHLTLSQKLNLLIYGSFIIGAIYVLNRDYDSVVSHWFVTMFPKEAKTLGFRL